MNPVPIFVKIILRIFSDEWLAEKIALLANFRYTLIKIETEKTKSIIYAKDFLQHMQNFSLINIINVR